MAGLFPIAACVPGAEFAADAPISPHLTTPEITVVSIACDVPSARWQLDVEATSWTSGGVLHWTIDGHYEERHAFPSREAEPDGSHDALRLSLGIVSDKNDVSPGSTTAFLCSDDPAFRVFILDPDGDVADCRFSGDPSVWATQPDVPACDTPVEGGDSTE